MATNERFLKHPSKEFKSHFYFVPGTKMSQLTTVVLHFLYFIMAIVSAAFLQTPAFTRLVLLLLVPVNAIAELRQGQCLGFLPMTLLIILTVTGWSTSTGHICCLLIGI